MPRSRSRIAVASCALLLTSTVLLPAQRQTNDHGVVIIATGADAPAPVPTVATFGTNWEVANLLFLRLAEMGPTLTSVGDRGFIPALARAWNRRDSLTLVFELDPRALWHDGRPVTAADVIFTFARSQEIPDLASALRRVKSVSAEGDHRVIFRFVRFYPEQLYDATHQMLIMPQHLLKDIPLDSLPTSAFAQKPVGNGPFRWVRRVPGQLIELAAFDRFFLGRPKIDRVYFRVASDPDARLNLLLAGEADVAQSLSLPAEDRVRQDSNLVVTAVPSGGITYALFNQKANGDRGKPHPILSDPVVRRALILALDRPQMARSVYGGHTSVPDGPVPQMFAWVQAPGERIVPSDTARARAMLASAGWLDHDRDGILDKNGIPFELSVNTPNRTPQRPMLAQQMQARLLPLGIKLNVRLMEYEVSQTMRDSGQFDIDMASANLDPTPSGWDWSWSCANVAKKRQNVGSYCNPEIDSLLLKAQSSRDPVVHYRRILALIRSDAPAIFLSSPANVIGVNKRYASHPFRPEMLWLSLRHWSVTPGQQLPRDRVTSTP
ncbi:MAG: ABC transporter substrate-binding protein [Gemmatimonadota bacterium]